MFEEPDALGGAARRDGVRARFHFGEGVRVVGQAGRDQPFDRGRAGGGEERRLQREAGICHEIHLTDRMRAAAAARSSTHT